MQDLKAILEQYEPKPLGEQRQYAVFLPLVWNSRSGIWEVLYQVRSESISQPGEVSFPGGAVEKEESLEEAAVRETMEELNISAKEVDVWGEIDYCKSKKILEVVIGSF